MTTAMPAIELVPSKVLDTRRPVDEERKRNLRRAMGEATWDDLEPYFTNSFLHAYDTVVDVLYGRGAPSGRAARQDGGWPIQDARMFEPKTRADKKCRRIIREKGFRKGSGNAWIKRALEKAAFNLWVDLDRHEVVPFRLTTEVDQDTS